MDENRLRCLFCGGDLWEPDHDAHCDGKQGGRDDEPDPPDDIPSPSTMAPLLDADLAKDVRDAAIEMVDDGATEDFKAAALTEVHRLALEREMFCSDDVWARRRYWPYTHDKRALGPVFLIAKRNQWIMPTEVFKPTAQVRSHASPMRFWRSLIQRTA